MKEAQIIARLKAEQADYAQQALRLPNEKTEFDFGYRVGTMAGLERAINLIFALIKESEEDKMDF